MTRMRASQERQSGKTASDRRRVNGCYMEPPPDPLQQPNLIIWPGLNSSITLHEVIRSGNSMTLVTGGGLSCLCPPAFIWSRQMGAWRCLENKNNIPCSVRLWNTRWVPPAAFSVVGNLLIYFCCMSHRICQIVWRFASWRLWDFALAVFVDIGQNQ